MYIYVYMYIHLYMYIYICNIIYIYIYMFASIVPTCLGSSGDHPAKGIRQGGGQHDCRQDTKGFRVEGLGV